MLPNVSERHRWAVPGAGVLGAVAIAMLVGALLGVVGLAVTAAAAVALDRPSIAFQGGVVGSAATVGGFCGAAVLSSWRRSYRWILASATGLVTAMAAVCAVGFHNPEAMAVGARTGCMLGMGRCELTQRDTFPVLIQDASVQQAPVVHVIIWGATSDATRATLTEEGRAAQLGQPLLEDFYGVSPARSAGYWRVPGDPMTLLHRPGHGVISARDLAGVIDQARAAEHWADTRNTQWWIATDLNASQIGIRQPGCADHVHVPGVAGAVIRLPFGNCGVPGRWAPKAVQGACSPLAVVNPTVQQPRSVEAGIDLIIDHEFAETATDPGGGWQLVVASGCQAYVLMEIADVCDPNGSFIAAPAYLTGAGWQPSLLEPGRRGRPATCVDPTRP